MARSNSKSPDRKGSSLYITNLSYSVIEEELQKSFEEYGKILDFNIIKDPISNKSRGFGFVTYENDDDAEKAKNELNNRSFNGRELKVEKAKRNKAHIPTPGKYMGTEKYKRSPNRDYRNKERGYRNNSRDRDNYDRKGSYHERDHRDRYRERDNYKSRNYKGRDSERDRRGSRSPRRRSRSPQSRSTYT